MTAVATIQPKRPPVNAIILAAIQKVAEAIEALTERGFTVVDVELTNPARPTIRIQTHRKCLHLIAQGAAAYFSYGKRGIGTYREGQFALAGCRIVWTESGH